ncbi:MAG: hypothetical protein ABIN61_05130 [candidate division WOR-3 bacterium]
MTVILLFSFIEYNVEIETFKRGSIYSNNLNLSLANRGKWLFSQIEGGIGFDYTSTKNDFGLSDILIKSGANRSIREFHLSLFPIFHFPGRTKEGLLRNFSIKEKGKGIGIDLLTKLLMFRIENEFEFITYSTEPVLRHYLFNSKIQFNPDTLIFSISYKLERFLMLSQTPFMSVYITPNIILSKWNNFELSLGISFLLFGERKEEITPSNILLREAGVNTGYYGIPSWSFSFGISSKNYEKKIKELLSLRIFLVDEEGNPISGFVSVADLGSFQIREGEMKFELPKGIYPISAYADNFISTDTVVLLKEKTDIFLKLRERKQISLLKGKIKDVETEEPISAKIIIENSDTIKTQNETETGEYNIYLSPGNYILKIISEGYYPYTSLIEVKQEEVIEYDFKMLPIKRKK